MKPAHLIRVAVAVVVAMAAPFLLGMPRPVIMAAFFAAIYFAFLGATVLRLRKRRGNPPA